MTALNDYDKQQINMIDEQVKHLLSKGASDDCILKTLMDFVPDVQCFISSEDLSVEHYIKTKPHFLHFASLIQAIMN